MLDESNYIINIVRNIYILQFVYSVHATKKKETKVQEPKNHTRRNRPNSSTFYLLKFDLRKYSEFVAHVAYLHLEFFMKWIIAVGGRVDCPVQINKIFIDKRCFRYNRYLSYSYLDQ